jgi:ubiquinol-cytochrome c reductase cytochrome c1 subunit
MKTRTGTGALRQVLNAIVLGLFLTTAGCLASAEIPMDDLDVSDAAVKRGEAVFSANCQTCHSLKYPGLAARMDEGSAQKAFGKAPPDLSLMAKARGRGSQGARYIYSLLVSYNDKPTKNSVFPGIAMPPPFAKDDPQLLQAVKDVSAFLFHVADPSIDERTRLGKFVLGYMIVLTALLYLLYRKTWSRVKRRSS